MPRWKKESVEVEGEWTNHAKYGRQFKIESYRPVYPTTLEGIQKYLGSGLIKGVGPVSAKRIVEHFGEDTLDIIDADPHRLEEVPKLGKKRVDMIAEAWEGQRQIKDVMVFLQSHGITTGYAVKIFKQYGQDAIQKVRSNPYRLERDIRGIGFRIADRIAQSLGLGHDAPQRVQAGIRYLLNQAADNGHVYLPAVKLIEQARDILEINAELIPPALEALRADDGIVTEDLHYYLPPLYHSEVGVASSLRRLLRAPAAELASPLMLRRDEMATTCGAIFGDASARSASTRTVVVSRSSILRLSRNSGRSTVTCPVDVRIPESIQFS